MADYESLKDSCTQNWKELKRLHRVVESKEPIGIDPSRSRIQVLKEQEKRLRAELQYLKENRFHQVSSDPEEQRFILREEQQKQIQQSEELLIYLRAKRDEYVEDIEKEETLHENLTQINQSLKEKVIAQEKTALEDQDAAIECAMNRIKADVEKVDKMDKYFVRELKKLVANLYPLPKDNAEHHPLDDTRDFDSDNGITFSNLIKLLIEQTINHPAQPYIDINERVWSQHVEFLLRCKIAVKDPNNSDKLKLVPFHM